MPVPDTPDPMDEAHQILNEVFGFPSFRLSQEQVIRRLIVDNENALVLFPTGGGKSLTYQVPAMCLDGLTLVISPLIALMKDQVDALVNRGVEAANLDSTLTAEEASNVKSKVLNGTLKLLYVAPERLNNEGFMALMRKVRISLLAVDESHCISQWGTSFRPEYLKVARFAEEMEVERILCLTATAVPQVADDICRSFQIDSESGVFRTPVYRQNLALLVQTANTLEDKMKTLVPFLKKRTGPSIIYVTLQKQAQEAADYLKKKGVQAAVYHAGLSAPDRAKIQNAFMASKDGVVCCTIAFGMGIDKADIRQVVHLYMPKTLENYSQEIGRAGRDGKPSQCLLYLSAPDFPVLEGFARGDTCAKADLQEWLVSVLQKVPARDGSLDFSLYEQSRLHDIRSNTLGLLYAQLELEFGLLRAVTPFYGNYEIIPRTPANKQKILQDKSPAAEVLRRYWSPRTDKFAVDVVHAASHSGTDRNDLAMQISRWELDGLVTTKASTVRNRFIITGELPQTLTEIEEIATKMWDAMLIREEDGVKKLREVVDFATVNDCLAHRLATYFGDDQSVPGGRCNSCTVCEDGHPVVFDPTCITKVEPARIKAILAACPERDDARLLTRFAFGITSPRLTAMKLSSSHPLFGSMDTVDFSLLLRTFQEECDKAGGQRAAAPAATQATKRPYSAVSQGASQGSWGSKRGRGAGGSVYIQRGGRGGYGRGRYTGHF